MTRRQRVGAAFVAAAMGTAPFACSSPQAPLEAGSQCFQTTDCQPGLFCVQQPGKASTCSTDLTATVSTEDAAAGKPPAKGPGGDGGDAAGRGDTGGSEGAIPPVEAGMPEASAAETAPPIDAGMPPNETSTPEAAPMDAAKETSGSMPDAAGDATGE